MGKIVYTTAGITLLVLGFAFQAQATNPESEALLKDLITNRGISDEEGFFSLFREVYGYDFEEIEVPNAPVFTGNGGPDSFGYTFTHIPFSFVNLEDSTVDTTVSEKELGDDNFFDLPLPFNFPFYGQVLNTVRVSSNGYLTVPGQSGSISVNRCIPNAGGDNNLIAVNWDDLWGLGAPVDREIRYTHRTGGTVDSTIIQYNKWGFFVDTGRKQNTFQVILESTGYITFNYLNVDSTIPYGPHSATAGIENSAGSVGLQVACNNPDGNGHIKDSTSIRISPPCIPMVVDAGSDQTVFFGYKPLECADLSATVSGGTPPYTFLWSTGETNQVITVCPTDATTYTVTVTDSKGCSEDDEVTINVVDVRCGHKNDKVLVCHIPPGNPENLHNICIDENGVPAHLRNHGDYLGPCNSSALLTSSGPSGILLFQNEPNPFNQFSVISYQLPVSAHTTLTVYDITGRLVETLVDESQEPGVYQLPITSHQLPGSGIYFCRLEVRAIHELPLQETSSRYTVTRKLVILR